jgi:hypothetical protein
MHPMSDDWIQELMRDFQDRITCGALRGVFRLDDNSVDIVMQEQASTCVAEFVKLYDLPADMGLDAFLERMTIGGPSKIDIERDGDTILWKERHEGECMCPLVRREVIELNPKLCNCAVHWLRMLVERHTKRPVRVELLDSVAQGNKDCIFRVTLEDGERAQ